MTLDALDETTTELPAGPVAKPKMAWTPCKKEDIVQAVEDLVHFSFKYINTNVTGGVRLARSHGLDLPYVALSTHGTADVPLDYCSSTPVSRQAVAMLNGRHEELYAGIPAGFAEQVLRDLVIPCGAAEVKCELIPHRLRQIIVQDDAGVDLALTPLVSAGFFRVLQNRIHEHYAAHDERRRSDGNAPTNELRSIRRAYLHFGGSNPFNGGKQMIAMRRPLWFAAPVEDRNIRRALAIYHKGIDLGANVTAIKDVRNWRRRIAHTAAGGTIAARAGGDPQVEMIQAIAKPVVIRARAAAALLERMREYLPRSSERGPANPSPTSPLTSAALPTYMRALLDPASHYPGWRHDVAYQIYLRIIGTTFDEQGRPSTIGLAENEANRVWVAGIEDLL